MAPAPPRCLAALAIASALVRADPTPAAESTLSALVQAVNRQTPKFAGPRADARSALCFSGGGSRSLAASVGQLRALEAIGALPLKADAISSVSGGTWAASQYMYAAGGSRELLGGLSEPSQLTMELLGAPLPKIAAAANASTNDILGEVLAERLSECDGGECPTGVAAELWTDVISRAVLGPHGLDGDMRMAASEQAAAEILDRNPAWDDDDVAFSFPRRDRPSTFVMNGVILAPPGFEAGQDNMVSLQMSTDYVGSPFFPDGSPSVVYSRPRFLFGTERTSRSVGGGFVESFAFGGAAPAELPEGGGEVEVGRPARPFRLADAVAISSAAQPPSDLLADAVNPEFSYWHIQPGTQAEVHAMGDGGALENSGLLAMLQSGVEKAVVFANTDVPLNPDASETGSLCDFRARPAEWFGLVPGTTLADAAARSLTCLFGHCKELEGFFYFNNQVFPGDQLQPLLCDLERLREAGKPAVVKRTLDVVRNDWWGIEGGRQVEVVWFYNERVADFEALLPEDTRNALAQGDDGPFARFPLYRTNFQNGIEFTAYTAEQINLLSAQTQYAVQQNAELVCSVIGC